MRIICYGDSNTFCYDPRSYFGSRYPAEFRWVDILAARTGWEIHNNGMNGRVIPRRTAQISKSMDLLIIMLGTNDLLQGASADVAASRMEAFLKLLPFEKEKILLIAPPPMKLGQWVTDEQLVEESRRLAYLYQNLSERLHIRFADAGEWNVSMCFDGVHFTEDGHIAFSSGLYNYLMNNLDLPD